MQLFSVNWSQPDTFSVTWSVPVSSCYNFLLHLTILISHISWPTLSTDQIRNNPMLLHQVWSNHQRLARVSEVLSTLVIMEKTHFFLCFKLLHKTNCQISCNFTWLWSRLQNKIVKLSQSKSQVQHYEFINIFWRWKKIRIRCIWLS